MRVVIQRVSKAAVEINGNEERSIGNGLVVLAGFEESDTDDDVEWTAKKIVQLRIFGDENGKMNRSIEEINGEIMLVSQFTLHASTVKGNRPSFIKAAKPEIAVPLYNKLIDQLGKIYKPVVTGEFGANMKVSLTNDGPVTIIIDSKNRE